jgi:hypothetical protein
MMKGALIAGVVYELRGMNILYFNANYRNFLGWRLRKLAASLSERKKMGGKRTEKKEGMRAVRKKNTGKTM